MSSMKGAGLNPAPSCCWKTDEWLESEDPISRSVRCFFRQTLIPKRRDRMHRNVWRLPRKEEMMRATILLCCLLGFSSVFAGERVGGTPAAMVERYRCLPGGVILESTAVGFEPVTSVTYDKKLNVFTVNGTTTYTCPVKGKEFRDILQALSADDRIGVSLNREYDNHLVFGKLGKDSDVATTLIEADKFLTGVTFAIPEAIGDVKLPGNYQPRAPASRPTNIVGCVNFTNYRFEKRGAEYVRSGFSMNVILMPVLRQKTGVGGHMPDDAALKDGQITPEDQANARHIEQSKDAYAKDVPLITRTVAYGEAAAFARLLRDSKLDLKALIKQF